MPQSTKRSQIVVSEEEKIKLINLSQSRKGPLREIQRAKIILNFVEKKEITEIAKEVGVSRPTVYKCIDKAISMGIEAALKDYYHSPKQSVITEEAKAWVINIACKKPKDLGQAAEVWSRRSLASYVRENAPKEGYTCLAKANKATVHRILKENPIRPHKVAYYLERRDPEFDEKMKDILMIYKEVQVTKNLKVEDNPESSKIITVSVDEKPGVQAIRNISPDILPNPMKNSRIMRDYEYERLGTVSILAALDLQDGHVIAQVHDRHRSIEFISLLKELDQYYPPDYRIRLILDNHSAHVSKETRAYLATKPNRFIYVHTPKHGSWLNLVETLFGKMARTFLKYIRVESKEELKRRILKGIEEINMAPVVHRWKKFDIEVKY